MARVSSKYTCTACETKLSREDAACTRCGHPTDHATMEQRVVWELGRWQQSRDPAAPRAAADPRPAARPAAPVAAPSPVAKPLVAAPRASGATAPAYDFRPDVETRPEPARPELVRPYVEPAQPAASPIVTDRPEAEPQRRRPAPLSVAPETAQAPAATATAEIVEESRKDRKSRERAEAKQRAAEAKAAEAAARAEEKATEAAARADEKAAEAAARAEEKRQAEADRAERRREAAEAGSRSDRRKARRQKHLTDGITLHDGETITLTMGGWSRGRPAVLVFTRFRVALITKLPNTLHWIPLEEVSKVSLRWRLGWTLEVEGSVEFLSFHKRSKQTLIAAKELLTSEVAESRAPGGRRHHPEVTQDWCDRSIAMWETHAGQIRLFIRRHPLLVVATLAIWVPVAYYFALR